MNKISKKSNFTTMTNAMLRDSNISFKAKGLFAYMSSMSEGWNFTIRSIATQQKDGKASIESALNELKKFGYVTYQRHMDGTGVYTLIDEPHPENKDMDEPHPENPHPENPHPENRDVLRSNNTKNKNNKSEVSLIVAHLNELTHKRYSSKAKETVRLIKARIKEGYTTSDFIQVIDTKCNEWTNKPDMEKYLRPETLFGNKFDKYLNEAPRKPKKGGMIIGGNLL